MAPQSGKESDCLLTCTELLSVIQNSHSTEILCEATCDSTNVNTREYTGVIRKFE